MRDTSKNSLNKTTPVQMNRIQEAQCQIILIDPIWMRKTKVKHYSTIRNPVFIEQCIAWILIFIINAAENMENSNRGETTNTDTDLLYVMEADKPTKLNHIASETIFRKIRIVLTMLDKMI